ncbi:MAG: hypothetical protein B6D61_09045, partial [Bacteroidetes bacterium 4484_249]
MKKFIFLFHLILFTILNGYFFDVIGQNDIYHFKYEVHNTGANTYGNPTEFITSNISSDYGKRKIDIGSRWHRGVDFGLNVQASSGRWDHFLSLNTGTIKKLEGGQGYKYIITEGTEIGYQYNFGYGHIFDASAANPVNVKGDLVLIIMDPPYDDDYAIIDLTNERAFGPQVGTVTYNNITYTVTTSIEQDEVLGNIGRSGASNYSYMHVHVYMFDDINQAIQNHNNVFNDRDPLQFISHVNTTYNVIIQTDNNVNAQNVITSSGADAISFKVRYTMENAGMFGNRFSSAIMDIDDVDIFIKESNKPNENYTNWGTNNSNYKLITGQWIESHLSHGARLTSDIYPVTANYGHSANPPTNTVINIAGNTYGDFNNTGIDPFAYWDYGNQPYDDYYFSDFYTRVIADYQVGGIFAFAGINSQAKYPDGSYNLYVKTETVRGNVYTSIDNGIESPEIIIDNFPPYVKKLEIFANSWTSNDLKYSAEWILNEANQQLEFTDNTFSGIISNQENINHFVVVTFSEEMSQAYMTIDGLGISHEQYMSNSTGDPNAKIFYLDGNILNGAQPGDYTITIEDAKDLAQTELYGFHNTNSLSATNYPKRQSDGVWSPTYSIHTDNIHGFTINQSDLQADFFADPNSIGIGDEAYFFDISTGELIESWEWVFEGGTPSSSTAQSPGYILYENSGEFDVTLTITNSSQQTSTVTKENYIKVGEIPTADFYADVTNANIEEYITFNDASSENTTSWHWNFGDGNYSNSQNPVHLYNDGGVYTVTLTATNQYGADTETKSDYITINDPRPNPNFNTNDGITNIEPENYLSFIDNSSNTPTSWFWTFEGATPSTSTEQNPSGIYYPNIGAYDVTLSVSNEFGTKTITKDDFILVTNPAISLEVDCFPEYFSYTVGESVKFTANVQNGTGPYIYSFNFNNENIYTFTSSLMSYTAEQTVNSSYDSYFLSVTVSDANDNTSTCTNSVAVQQIGASHNVDFSWNPSNPILGQNISFINNTTGGSQPYMQSYWQWFEDPNTGSPSWAPHSEILWAPNSLNSPAFVANYNELGNYPVKLTVTDAQGWPSSKTKILHFVPADECLFFDGSFPIGMEDQYAQVGDEENFYANGDCCYSPSCNMPQECNYITNFRWKLFDKETGLYVPNSTIEKYNECSCYELSINGSSDCQEWQNYIGNHTATYTFNSGDDKEYIIQCEIWNKCKGEYDSLMGKENLYLPGKLNPDMAQDLAYYDVGYRQFRVVDCESEETYTLDITLMYNPEVWAGKITLGGEGDHKIHPNAAITYVAHNEIIMAVGFEAMQG